MTRILTSIKKLIDGYLKQNVARDVYFHLPNSKRLVNFCVILSLGNHTASFLVFYIFISIQQHFSRFCMLSIYLPIDSTFQSLRFLLRFSRKRVTIYMESIERGLSMVFLPLGIFLLILELYMFRFTSELSHSYQYVILQRLKEVVIKCNNALC